MLNPDQAETRNLLNIGVKLGSMICFCRGSSVSLSTLLSSSSPGLQSDQNQIILRNDNHINYKLQFLNTLRTNFVNPIRYIYHIIHGGYIRRNSEWSVRNKRLSRLGTKCKYNVKIYTDPYVTQEDVLATLSEAD